MTESPNLESVKSRRVAIKAELATLNDRAKELVAEDQDLAVAERVLMRLSGAPDLPRQDPLREWLSPKGWQKPDRPQPENGTVEEVTAWLLEGSVDPWATANQIQAALSATLRRPVPSSTVSPTLTSMKNKGILVRDGLKVALKSRVPNFNSEGVIRRR